MIKILPLFIIVSVVFLTACQTNKVPLISVKPTVETQAVNSEGDAADDPAVWISPNNPNNSLILGTQKKQGLYSFDLQGNVVQFIKAGRLNNIDVRQKVKIDNQLIDIAAASNRSTNNISLFTIESNGTIRALNSFAIEKSALPEVYGFCMGHVKQNIIFVVTGKDANAEIYQLDKKQKKVEKIRNLKIATQSEGCVVDDENGDIYIGEENHGIWRFNYFEPHVKHSLLTIDNTILKADIEGLALFTFKSHKYLMISSQGNNTYPIYNLTENTMAGRIKIKRSDQFDGVTGTDGIEVSQQLKTNQFPDGIFIVQDDKNTKPSLNQNFKFISLADILNSLEK